LIPVTEDADALVRDQMVSTGHKAGNELEAKARHVRHKAQGVVAEAKGAMERRQERAEEAASETTRKRNSR
jgi:hypothetical protein